MVVLKQYTSACEDLERALRISLLSAHIHVDIGQLLLTMNELIEAEKHFLRALEIRPCHLAVYEWQGDARPKQVGKWQETLDNYRTSVELNDTLQLALGSVKAPAKMK